MTLTITQRDDIGNALERLTAIADLLQQAGAADYGAFPRKTLETTGAMLLRDLGVISGAFDNANKIEGDPK